MNKKFLLWIIAMLILCSSVFGALTDNLRDYYRADESSGDLIGVLGINYTIVGSVSQNAGIINFSRGEYGVTDYFQRTVSPWGLSDSTNYSISIWVYSIDESIESYQVIERHSRISNHNFELFYNFASSEFWAYMEKSGGGSAIANYVMTPSAASWTFLTMTFEASTNNLTLYVNGVYRDSALFSDTGIITSDQDLIGAEPSGTNPCNEFYLDEIGHWDRVLTPAEVTQLYNSGTGFTYPFAAPQPPNINVQSYNLTTADVPAESLYWRNFTTKPIISSDATPTMTLSTDTNAYCRISRNNSNWTVMGGPNNCSTTGTTSHVCTLSASEALDNSSCYESIYVACIDSTMTFSNASSMSGSLNLSIPSCTVNCNITMSGIQNNSRYQDIFLSNVMLGCTNRNISTCQYTINDYALTTPSDCNNISLILEIGNNEIIFSAANGTMHYNVWAKKLNATFSDYMLLIIIVAAFVGFIIAGTKIGIFYVLAGIMAVFAGIYLIAFSVTIAVLMMIMGLFLALMPLF